MPCHCTEIQKESPMGGGDKDTRKLAILYLLQHCTLDPVVVVVEKECREAGVWWMTFDRGGNHFMGLVSMHVTPMSKLTPSTVTQNLIHFLSIVCQLHGAEFLVRSLMPLHLVKKWPTCYGTWRFINVFTKYHHMSASRARYSTPLPPNRLPSNSLKHYPPIYI